MSARRTHKPKRTPRPGLTRTAPGANGPARRPRGTRRFVILTGLSGAGKTQAIRALEDLGFFCVDNLPSAMIPTMAELASRADDGLEGEPRLTSATSPCQRHQAVGSEETLQVRYLRFAANKAGDLLRKVLCHNRVRCS